MCNNALLDQADYVIELYGEGTVAAEFAQQVKASLKGWGSSPHSYGEYEHKLEVSNIPLAYPFYTILK